MYTVHTMDMIITFKYLDTIYIPLDLWHYDRLPYLELIQLFYHRLTRPLDVAAIFPPIVNKQIKQF